ARGCGDGFLTRIYADEYEQALSAFIRVNPRQKISPEGGGVAGGGEGALELVAELEVAGDDLAGVEDLLAAALEIADAAAGLAHQQHAGGDVPGLHPGLEVTVGAAAGHVG